VPVDLPALTQPEIDDCGIDSVYFIERGFASVVANDSGKRRIEVGIIGREGMTGLAVVMGNERAPHDTYIQAAGAGHRIGVAKLRSAMDQGVSLQGSLLHCAHSFFVQTTQTALANGGIKIAERLARWLLMADDCIDGSELPLTHELLSIILGVQRSGVTVAASSQAQETHQTARGVYHRHQ
jgi:CRP-like cAMP-binding protein